MFPAFVRRFWLRASRAGAATGATALSTLAPLQARWQRLSTRHQHWGINILIGLCIETLVHIAGHNLHWPAVVAAQDRGLDTMTRLHAWACEDPSPGGSSLQRLLHCPDTQPGRPAPVLLDIDEATWRDPAWDGGEPVRAPRQRLLELAQQAFALDASSVVMDVAVEELRSGTPAGEALRAEDQAFAHGLSALLPHMKPGQVLVLVRTVRPPFPAGPAAPWPVLRRSPAVDEVVAASGGRIVLAAPYFRVDPDRLTRSWVQASTVCLMPASGDGQLAVLPSVQWLLHARALGLATPAWRQASLEASVAAPAACPDPARQPATAPAEQASHEAHEAMRRFGEAVLAASPAQARPLLAQALPDPHHDLANRVVFRMSPAGGSLLSVPALQWLDQPATQLAAPFGELVKGRVVIIGQTHSGAADFFQTPLGEMAGAIVLANAIDSMQAFGQLGQPSPLVMAAVSLLLIVAVGYVFARWDSVIGTLVATALVVLTAGVASFLLFAQGVWLDVAAPILGIQLHRLWASFEEQQHFRRLKKEHGHAHG